MRKFLAISGLPLNPYPSSQNHAIWSQFVPKLEYLIYYDSLFGFFLIYILNFNFSEFKNDEVQQIDKIKNSQFSSKNNLVQFVPK